MFKWASLNRIISRSLTGYQMPAQRVLTDSFNRKHDYLRISLTDKCNLRCRYCMPQEGIVPISRSERLDISELVRITDIFVKLCGVKKIRLTGGEPMISKQLIPVLEHLASLKFSGLKEVAMTTNGVGLIKQVNLLKNLGLDRINISLDTLKPERFEVITRRKGWSLVIDGLHASISAGFKSVKLNCVVMKGFNDDEVEDFAKLAADYPIEVRFIEFMPMGGNNWARDRLVHSQDIIERLVQVYPKLCRLPKRSNETSRRYKDPAMQGSIGFISTMSNNFCSDCNRLRLTSDGLLKICLFGTDETNLRAMIREGATDDQLVESIVSALNRKRKSHAGSSNLGSDFSRPMIKVEFVRQSHSFSHLDEQGRASMVNIDRKLEVKRVAKAEGRIHVGREVLNKIDKGSMVKGDVLSVSRMAGMLAAKQTSNLIPLCHQILLSHISVNIESDHETGSLLVEATVETKYGTGVEMEALTAVSVTLLSLYDMCKSINKSMIISDVRLIFKTKG